jgi:hypothetical protein
MPYQPPTPNTPEAMNIEGLTTCVNYADFLDHALTQNLHHFDEFVVVTSHDDRHTQAVCQKHGVRALKTDLFTERGEQFNKGNAINLGLAHLRSMGWILHLDADIVLPDRFRSMLHKAALDQRNIYGADRINVRCYEDWQRHREMYFRQYHHFFLLDTPDQFPLGARLIHNEYGYCPIGYFQLWHASTQMRYPVNQGSAEHTDVLFSMQWPRAQRILLPTIICYHLESERARMGANWEKRTTKPFAPKNQGQHKP